MEEKIAALRAELEADLAAVHNKDELSAFWQKYLSKNGSVTGLTKSLRDVPKEERPAAGKTINEFKVWVEGQYQAASAEIEKAELAARYGIPYIIMDEGWSASTTDVFHPNPDLDLQELIAYGRERNVQIVLWLTWLAVEKDMDRLFATLESGGFPE